MSHSGISFWLLFCPVDPDPRVFLRFRIREAKILRIQRIRILSSAGDHEILVGKDIRKNFKILNYSSCNMSLASARAHFKNALV